jgi:hypothetical protein
VTNKTFGNYAESIFTITDGVSVSLDPNNGPIQTWELGLNRTPSASASWASGQSITLLIDDGAGRTITWTTVGVQWKTNGGLAPTFHATNLTVLQLWKVGSIIYGARVGDV